MTTTKTFVKSEDGTKVEVEIVNTITSRKEYTKKEVEDMLAVFKE